MNKAKVEAEMAEDSKIWRDQLFGIVPVEYLSECFKRAGKNQTSGYAPNAYQIINEWQKIKEQEREKREKLQAERAAEQAKLVNPVDVCPNKEKHINEFGEVAYFNPFNPNSDLILPCHACRPKAYEDQRARFNKKHNRTLDEKETLAIYEQAVQIEKPAPVEYDLVEMDALAQKHNELVFAIIGEVVPSDMLVRFDEGGNCFKHPHTAAITYSPENLEKKIERYQQILDERKEAKK